MAKLILSIEEIEDEIHEDLVEIIEEATETPEMAVESEEDEEIAIEEMFNEISSEISENDKVFQVVDGLDDIKIAVGDKDELTPTEISLIDVAANMGTAGTDIEGSQLLPATEKFSNKNFALETLSARIAVAQEGIMDSVKSVYGKITDFIKKLFSYLHKTELKLKEAKIKLNDIKKSKTKEVTISVKKSRFLLKDRINYVADTQEYLSVFKDTLDFYSAWADTNIKSVTDFDGVVGTWFKTLANKEKTNDETEKLYNAYVKSYMRATINTPLMSNISSSLDPHYSVFESKPLLGGMVIRAKQLKDIPDFDLNNIKKMKKAVSSTTISVAFNRSLFLPKVDENNTKYLKMTFTASDIGQIITNSEKALSIYKKYLDKTYRRFININNSLLIGSVVVFKPIVPVAGMLAAHSGVLGLHTQLLHKAAANGMGYVEVSRHYLKLLTTAQISVVNQIMNSHQWNAEKV